MAYTATTATNKLLKLNKRLRVVSGGTAASKTISILLILIDYSQTHEGQLISIVSESMPHIKRGAMRDFLNIMKTHGYYKEDEWNRTDSIYTFPNGTQIEFFGVDSPDKVRGPRRDVLFINECNNVNYETFNQLEVRTRKHVWLDFNPVSEFWFYEHIHGNDDFDYQFVTLTYKDNEALGEEVVKSIESRKGNKNWWQVYGLGQLGEVEGRIYTGWKIIDTIPHEARLVGRGLDFGYTNDPTAIDDIYEYNGGYIIDERLHRKGMTNKQIADFLNSLEFTQTIADSAEPKSIDEIDSYGVTILPAIKGKGSINQGISLVQSLPISITKRSVNTIKEYRNYLWKTDRVGKTINIPQDFDNHHMDDIRYAISEVAQNPVTDAKPYVPPAVQSLRARHNTGMPTTRPDFLR